MAGARKSARLPCVHLLPWVASLADADRMIALMNASGKELIINWRCGWCGVMSPRTVDSRRLIGEVFEAHYYDGNHAPLYHGVDKIEREPTA